MGERKAPRSGRRKVMKHRQIGADDPATAAEQAGRMAGELQDHIGRELRALYNEVLDEPVPDRFLKLLDELERKQAKS